MRAELSFALTPASRWLQFATDTLVVFGSATDAEIVARLRVIHVPRLATHRDVATTTNSNAQRRRRTSRSRPAWGHITRVTLTTWADNSRTRASRTRCHERDIGPRK